MKKFVLILAAVSFSFIGHSQIKTRVIFSAEGSYNEASINNGTTLHLNETEGHYLVGGISAGFFLTDRFIVGFGLEFNKSAEDRYALLILNNSYIQEEKMKIKSSLLSPNLYAGWYFKIINNFYCNVNLKISYGKINTEYQSKIGARSKFTRDSVQFYPIDGSLAYSATFESDSKFDYFSAGIHPQVTYFMTKNFGIYISLGSIEYSILDWENDNSEWNANFNPSYWRFGVKLRLQSSQTITDSD